MLLGRVSFRKKHSEQGEKKQTIVQRRYRRTVCFYPVVFVVVLGYADFIVAVVDVRVADVAVFVGIVVVVARVHFTPVFDIAVAAVIALLVVVGGDHLEVSLE